MTGWLAQWGTLAIAAVALAQPWMIGLYNRFWKRPKVSVHPTAGIEIGYSQLGGTVGLHGTMVVTGRAVFIDSIDLEVIRLDDNATHSFGWSLFRGLKARASNLSDVEVELAAGFILKPGQPRRYNILFQDLALAPGVRHQGETLQREWVDMLRAEEGSVLLAPVDAADSEARLERFWRREVVTQSWSQLDRMRFWEVGRYRLKMVVSAADFGGKFAFVWQFELDETQVELLRQNAVETVRSSIGQGTGHYNFAYPDYELPDDGS